VTRTPLSRSKGQGQLVADVLNGQRARTGATWRINTKILSTCRGRRHIVSPRAQLVFNVLSMAAETLQSFNTAGWATGMTSEP